MKIKSENIIPIIIVNWNGIDDTIECIESVQQLRNVNFKIYLVDNGSNDTDVEKINELYSDVANVDLTLNSSNLGFTKAHIELYNKKLQQLDVDFIALLNNDTIVDEDWLRVLLETTENHSADLVSSKMILYFDREIIDNTGHKMLNTGEILPIGHGEPIQDHNTVIENLGPCAGACLYSKKMIDKIGFFDAYFSTGYEDAEFGLRAILAGYKAIYAPKAIVYHKKGQSVKKIFNFEYSAMIQTSIWYSYFKNVPTFNILITMPFIIIKTLLLFIINILFLRKKFLMIQIKSWVTILNSAKPIMIKRQETKKTRTEAISTFDFIKRTKFFLLFDIKRFWKIFLLKNDSAIDSY